MVCVTASSTVPWYMMYSATDLLDRHLDVSYHLHAEQLQNAATAPHQNTSVIQSSTSVDMLRHELSLLHAELMFERQRREVHARRGRRLLSRINQLNSVADQNEAMVRNHAYLSVNFLLALCITLNRPAVCPGCF